MRLALPLCLALLLSTPALAEETATTTAVGPPTSDQLLGTVFSVTVTSSLTGGHMSITTWLTDDRLRSESTSGPLTVITIQREGMTYLINPELNIVHATPIQGPEAATSEAEAAFWPLIDPLQLAPQDLGQVFRELGARSLGTDALAGREVEALALRLPEEINLPMDNLRLYIDPASDLPVRLEYQRDRNDTVTVTFDAIHQDMPIDPARFALPEAIVVEYEW